MPGPRPTPTHLKLIRGNPGKRPIDADSEPQPERVAVPPSPPHLSAYATEAWDILAPILSEMGVLTVADFVALEMLCECYAEARAARCALEMLGDTVYLTKSPTGGEMRRPNPEVAQAADADRRLRGWMAEFGLTPSSRSKVARPDGMSKDDSLARFFN